MKTVKPYDNFAEEYRLNENVLSNSWSKVVAFFRKKYEHAWLYYMLFLKKIGKMPKAYDIFVPGDEIAPSESEVELAIKNEAISITRGATIDEELNEATVNLKSDTLENIDAKELREVIIDIYNQNKERTELGEKRDMNDAVFIWGAPGIGKTSILKQVAEELDILVFTWHLASTDPTDFRGVPTIENIEPGSTNPKDERTVVKLPAAFPTTNGPNGKGGILFFDELNQAKQMILSAALPIILEGEIGEYKIPDMFVVVAAGNREEDLGGGGTRFQAPMANRFGHYNYAPDLETDFIPYAIKNKFMNPDIINFLRFKPQYFHQLDPEKETLGWPSPRSWELASRKDYFKRGRNWDKPLGKNEMNKIYSPRIGREAAVAFMAYLELKKHFNEQDVKDVFTKGAATRPLPTQLDQAFAASGSIAGYKKGEDLTPKELKSFFEFAGKMMTGTGAKGLETATPLIAWLKTMHPEVKKDTELQKIYWDFVKIWHLEMKGLD